MSDSGVRVLRWLIVWLVPGWGMLAWGGEPEALSTDLDGDGRAERIDWIKFAETEAEGSFYQVRVTGGDGSLMWEGPKVAETENPLVFGDWHFGYSLPELAGDDAQKPELSLTASRYCQ